MQKDISMKVLTLGWKRIVSKRGNLCSSAALQTQLFSISTAPRDVNGPNPTPNPDIYPPGSPQKDPGVPHRHPDLYPPSPPSPPFPGDLPDTDPYKRDVNPDMIPPKFPSPDINPSDIPNVPGI